jgi:hypothetical protein
MCTHFPVFSIFSVQPEQVNQDVSNTVDSFQQVATLEYRNKHFSKNKL